MNKKTFLKLFVLAAVSVSMTACHHKDDVGPVNPPVIENAPNKVMGYITGLSGKSIAGAVITLNSESTTSNNEGYYEFVNVTSGSYTISVTATGMLSESDVISLPASDITQYYVWNASLYEDRSVKFNYETETGGESETTTESIEDNELAEIDIDLSIDANDISEDSEIILTPIYSEESSLLTKAVESGNQMLVGCIISASNPKAEIIKPINLTFNVGEDDAADFHAMIYKDGNWVGTESFIQNGAVVVPVMEFGGVGLFSNLTVSSSTTSRNLEFSQSYWDNTGGASSMQIGETSFDYMAGIEFKGKAQNSLEALIMEYIARNLTGLKATKRTSTYPINVSLPMGYFLSITGTQQEINLTVKHNQAEVTATNYGTCSFRVTSDNKIHSGGGDY